MSALGHKRTWRRVSRFKQRLSRLERQLAKQTQRPLPYVLYLPDTELSPDAEAEFLEAQLVKIEREYGRRPRYVALMPRPCRSTEEWLARHAPKGQCPLLLQ
jgi:hypothetical protein